MGFISIDSLGPIIAMSTGKKNSANKMTFEDVVASYFTVTASILLMRQVKRHAKGSRS